jgi:exonuclease SbcD
MTIRIFHMADVHLGMKFAHGYPPEVQNKLVNARYETLKKAVVLSNKQKCHVFLVAGDLFDNNQINVKNTHTAADILNQFEGKLVVIMPGNHDYIQPSSELWSRFQSKAGPSILVMDKAIPYDLRQYDLNLAFYPAPCTSRLSSQNAIGWVKTCSKLPGVAFHIGVAHGSIKGISPDFNDEYYPMTQKELQSLDLDLWLMGHTHIRYPDVEEGSDKKILFPATPEPDGFDCVHSGYAWIIDIEKDNTFKYRSVQTGNYRFFDWNVMVSNEKDIETLESQIKKLNPNNALVRLRLTGSLSSDSIDKLASLKDTLQNHVLYLKLDYSDLHRAVTEKDIDREFTKDSFPHRLLKKLVQEGNSSVTIQTAYDLIMEAKK